MVKVCDRANLNLAYKRVKANNGAPGIDGMTVKDLGEWLETYKDELIASLLDGSCQPQPVRGVQIPKTGGGKRQLGIPANHAMSLIWFEQQGLVRLINRYTSLQTKVNRRGTEQVCQVV